MYFGFGMWNFGFTIFMRIYVYIYIYIYIFLCIFVIFVISIGFVFWEFGLCAKRFFFGRHHLGLQDLDLGPLRRICQCSTLRRIWTAHPSVRTNTALARPHAASPCPHARTHARTKGNNSPVRTLAPINSNSLCSTSDDCV